MNGILSAIVIITIIPGFIAIMFTPYFTRKTESFGVSIPEDIYHSETLKSMRKQYVKLTALMSILTVAIFLLVNLFITLEEQTFGIMIGVGTCLYLLITFTVYLHFHREMKNLKAKEGGRRRNRNRLLYKQAFASKSSYFRMDGS